MFLLIKLKTFLYNSACAFIAFEKYFQNSPPSSTSNNITKIHKFLLLTSLLLQGVRYPVKMRRKLSLRQQTENLKY